MRQRGSKGLLKDNDLGFETDIIGASNKNLLLEVDMILRIHPSIFKIAARYGAISPRRASVYSEDSNYNVYKKAFNFHKNGGQDFPIPRELFNTLRAKGLVIDGSQGGLLIGPLHSEGGILTVRNYTPEPCLVGEIEGWEYLLSSTATLRHQSDIERINGYCQSLVNDGYWRSGAIPNNTTIIDMRHKLVDGKWERPLLLIQGEVQWCVNKFSTRLYLRELEEFNQSISR